MADGVWIDKPGLVKGEFFKHFSHRFDKPSAHRARIDVNFENTLSSNQIECLECDVTKYELKRAVCDCGVDKSPGPDGYTFGFYRHFWTTIEDNVFGAVNYFFTYGDFPKGCNSSFIALIPKIPDANMVKDFRPISLIGSIYKIIAKILANRLVSVLGGIVNRVQSAFITERQILDGPLIINEIMQWCSSKKTSSHIQASGGNGFKAVSGRREVPSLLMAVQRRNFSSTKVSNKKLKNQGIDFFEYLKLNLGDGSSFLFWEDCWCEGRLLKDVFPRLYALEMRKNISVKDKFSDPTMDHSFRRHTRDDVEQIQYNKLSDVLTAKLVRWWNILYGNATSYEEWLS
uniref:RNA-directed DNA polymerase, eukaryota, reverse transcriptase zinc-binding domain protein n=1 Tax=Tanacetum cinerariifolium TaxID=118510 RepID=A0A6L2LNT8_TANCI|nr:RNA-directed DNA polymerase, eukaryota, reverse transcriptase zinc-binding domain protein [Tanacetum cinerariifolium]